MTDEIESKKEESEVKTEEKQENKSNEMLKNDPAGYLRSLVNKTEDSEKEEAETKSVQTKNVGYTEAEKEAMRRYKWKPKEAYKGDPDNWSPAPQFLRERALRDEVKDLKVKQQQMLDLLHESNKADIERRRAETQKNKRKAIEDSNIEEAEKYEKEFRAYDDKLKVYDEQLEQQKKETPPQNKLDPAYLTFAANTWWFNNDTPENAAMQAYAGALDQKLRAEHSEWSVHRILGEVKLGVERKFPEMFPNEARERAPAVESDNYPQGQKSNKIFFEELPVKTQEMIDNFILHGKGKITREGYIKELQEMGVLKRV